MDSDTLPDDILTVESDAEGYPTHPEDRHVFVLAGLPGSGKSTAAEILVDELTHRFQMAEAHEVSDFCHKAYMAAHEGEQTDDNDLGRWTAKLKAEHGNDFIVREMARALSHVGQHLAISGVRSPAEAVAVRDVFGPENVTVIAIWTLPDERFRRKYDALPSEDHPKWDEFCERNDRELHEWGCLDFFTGEADYVVPNNDSVGHLEASLHAIIQAEVVGRESVKAEELSVPPFPVQDDEHVQQYL